MAVEALNPRLPEEGREEQRNEGGRTVGLGSLSSILSGNAGRQRSRQAGMGSIGRLLRAAMPLLLSPCLLINLKIAFLIQYFFSD